MNILLTGGAGYIGSHTAVVLSQHHVVVSPVIDFVGGILNEGIFQLVAALG